ncbi:MAG: hypothetical protein QM628_08450 [Propionicimonas sp.]|jgi:hypothetical protein
MAHAPDGWRQRWSLLVHRLKYGKVVPGSREHLEIIRIEEQRAEQVRKAMEERRRFGKY